VHTLHRSARLVHRAQRLLVDVGRFDRINLLFELNDLCLSLFEVLFVEFLPSESSLGRYTDGSIMSVSLFVPSQFLFMTVPFLFEATFFLAIAS
jgi:hypothetical protein